MQVNAKLNEQIAKAVRISMRIEGYLPTPSAKVRDKAKQLMERQRVQVSLPRE